MTRTDIGIFFPVNLRFTNDERRNYPVSGPKSSPLQSTQAQSPSMKDMGSAQMGQSGGGPLAMRGRSGSSFSYSSMAPPTLLAV
ncbi:hypothetical protein COMA2_250028 [Candidatus Nitrospira nitrificans]|uniref:Uncharacterized protein n=1 Tax=Candidatus Nitrospira nitrificans TaxID=1742973 RepID=A0A0S4LL75_9BACT|nr:hypothetical protein COMA2_250028 [Candidatus Nitrospira nitrificans]